MLFYYSGCGNSRWAAREVATALGDELRFIPDLQREGFREYTVKEGESLGFVFPIYAWAVPELVAEFIKQVRWSDAAETYIYVVCTCGDETGTTLNMCRKLLESVGLHQDAFFTFQMPETYLFFPGFHLDSKEKEQQKLKAARDKMPSVIEKIKQHQSAEDDIPGSLPALKSGFLRWGFNLLMTDRKFHTTDACTGCGLCSKVCPLKNIRMENKSSILNHKSPVWGGHCTQCAACYQHCPQNAIQFGRCTEGKGQYRFKR